MYQTIFEVVFDTRTVLVTMSESKAFNKADGVQDAWIVAKEINSEPHMETVYENTSVFREEYKLSKKGG